MSRLEPLPLHPRPERCAPIIQLVGGHFGCERVPWRKYREAIAAAEVALYNARPQWLVEAHAALDRAVFAAYGWPADLPDDEVLARLLAINLERPEATGRVAAEETSDEEGDE
jgi:hypothetical protein